MALRVILVAVPALRRVEPAITSGPVAQRDHHVGDAARRRRWAAPGAGDEHGAGRARKWAYSSAARDERRHARGGDAADRRPWGRPPPGACAARPRAALSSAPSTARVRACGPAGDDRHHQRRRDAEGGHALGRVQRAEAARGAGADVDQAPAGGQPVGHQPGGLGDLRRLAAHRLHGVRLLLHHQLDHLLGGQGVQQLGARVHRLGGQGGIVDCCAVLPAGALVRARGMRGPLRLGGLPRLSAISTMASSSSP